MNSVNPEWEPTPWDAPDRIAEPMYEGYVARVARPICWQPVPNADFPKDGNFGHHREWFLEKEVAYFAVHEGEDFLLMNHMWSGWPDPPRWSLASRPSGAIRERWQLWGAFSELPSLWLVPEEKDLNASNQ